MKKLLCRLLPALLLLSLLVLPASAESGLIFSVGSAEAAPGDSIVIDVSIKENPGTAAMVLPLSYDKDCLELLYCVPEGLPGMTVGENAVWVSGNNSNYTGRILHMSFYIRDDAPAGETYITIGGAEIYNRDEEEVAYDVEGGVVKVVLPAGLFDGGDTPGASSSGHLFGPATETEAPAATTEPTPIPTATPPEPEEEPEEPVEPDLPETIHAEPEGEETPEESILPVSEEPEAPDTAPDPMPEPAPAEKGHRSLTILVCAVLAAAAAVTLTAILREKTKKRGS